MVPAVRRYIRVGKNEIFPVRIHLDGELLVQTVQQNIKKKGSKDNNDDDDDDDKIIEFRPASLGERELTSLLELLIPYLLQYTENSYHRESEPAAGAALGAKTKEEFRLYGHQPSTTDLITIDDSGWKAAVFVPKDYAHTGMPLDFRRPVYTDEAVMEREVHVTPVFRKEDEEGGDNNEGVADEEDPDTKAKKNLRISYHKLYQRGSGGDSVDGAAESAVEVFVRGKPAKLRASQHRQE